jgi:hypothetical protein
VNETQKAAYIFSQAVSALVEAIGMHHENQHRYQNGFGPMYGEGAFINLEAKYLLGHNQVLSFFGDPQPAISKESRK